MSRIFKRKRFDLPNESLPQHVAIIMDGNGRWAKKHKLSVSLGHEKGTEALRSIIRHVNDLGIKVLTLYAFSTENWRRSKEEVSALMQLILTFFASEIDELDTKNVRIRILGSKVELPQAQKDVLCEAEYRTSGNDGLQLNIAVNYGGRAEIANACREIAMIVRSGQLLPEQIDESTVSEHLYTAGMPDVDLLIRTSGEKRLSNFLPWQTTYAEMVFPKTLWPDFTPEDFDKAIEEYFHRNRRFGKR